MLSQIKNQTITRKMFFFLGSQKVSFLEKDIAKEGLQLEKEKIEKFLKTLEIPKTVKQVKRLIGFPQLFHSLFHPEFE